MSIAETASGSLGVTRCAVCTAEGRYPQLTANELTAEQAYERAISDEIELHLDADGTLAQGRAPRGRRTAGRRGGRRASVAASCRVGLHVLAHNAVELAVLRAERVQVDGLEGVRVELADGRRKGRSE